jgi:phospholipase/carboxylesterase
MDDLKYRTQELADFVEAASHIYVFDVRNLVAVGYSNGANITMSMLF